MLSVSVEELFLGEFLTGNFLVAAVLVGYARRIHSRYGFQIKKINE